MSENQPCFTFKATDDMSLPAHYVSTASINCIYPPNETSGGEKNVVVAILKHGLCIWTCEHWLNEMFEDKTKTDEHRKLLMIMKILKA